MATHTQLPIYKAAYDLLDVSTDFVKNMQRDFKRSIGEKITNECIEITIAVFRANVARDKEPHLMDLLERLQVVELMIRLAMEKRLISNHAVRCESNTSTAWREAKDQTQRTSSRPHLQNGGG